MLLWRTRRKRSVIDPGRSCALAVHDGSKVAKWNITLLRGNMYGSQGGDVCKEGGFWVEHYVLCECEFLGNPNFLTTKVAMVPEVLSAPVPR